MDQKEITVSITDILNAYQIISKERESISSRIDCAECNGGETEQNRLALKEIDATLSVLLGQVKRFRVP
jgi:hypothetical protein